jgi:hypothetical protein
MRIVGSRSSEGSSGRVSEVDRCSKKGRSFGPACPDRQSFDAKENWEGNHGIARHYVYRYFLPFYYPETVAMEGLFFVYYCLCSF